MLDSVKSIQREYGTLLNSLEWGFTIIFTLEYLLRIYCVKHPLKYVFSFFGLVDLFSILPSYIAFYYSGASSLALIRGIRILRIFRILKLAHYLGEARGLSEAIKGSWAKIVVFLGATFSILLILAHSCTWSKVRKWFHEYSSKYLLGDCDNDDSWLWRYCA